MAWCLTATSTFRFHRDAYIHSIGIHVNGGDLLVSIIFLTSRTLAGCIAYSCIELAARKFNRFNSHMSDYIYYCTAALCTL